MQKIVELQKIGTLFFLFRHGKTNECWTEDNNLSASNAYQKAVRDEYDSENSVRKMAGRDKVTLESFETHCKCCPLWNWSGDVEPVNRVLSIAV